MGAQPHNNEVIPAHLYKIGKPYCQRYNDTTGL